MMKSHQSSSAIPYTPYELWWNPTRTSWAFFTLPMNYDEIPPGPLGHSLHSLWIMMKSHQDLLGILYTPYELWWNPTRASWAFFTLPMNYDEIPPGPLGHSLHSLWIMIKSHQDLLAILYTPHKLWWNPIRTSWAFLTLPMNYDEIPPGPLGHSLHSLWIVMKSHQDLLHIPYTPYELWWNPTRTSWPFLTLPMNYDEIPSGPLGHSLHSLWIMIKSHQDLLAILYTPHKLWWNPIRTSWAFLTLPMNYDEIPPGPLGHSLHSLWIVMKSHQDLLHIPHTPYELCWNTTRAPWISLKYSMNY